MNTKQAEFREKKKAKVLVIDAHPIARLGFARLLNDQPDMMICGEAGTMDEGIQGIRTLNPDVVILDPALKDANGFELIKTVKAENPTLKFLVVSAHEESLHADLALHVGADGHVSKLQPIEELLSAIRRVSSGQVYLSADMVERVLRAQADKKTESIRVPVERLSMREMEVFQLIGHWRRTQEIAAQLRLSVKTVEYYRHQIKEKLQLHNATELTRYATQWCQQQGNKPDYLSMTSAPELGNTIALPDRNTVTGLDVRKGNANGAALLNRS